MRELIRPALFGFARLGLFLAVVLWGVAQWWHFGFNCTFVNRNLNVAIHQSGLVCRFDLPLGASLRFFREPASNDPDVLSEQLLAGQRIVCTVIHQWPGISYTERAATQRTAIHHWLIVSTFILFYAILKFIYRRKPDGGEADA